jgi:hypothetical protein
MGFLDNMMKRGGSSEEVEGYTPTGPGTDIATSGGRRRRKSVRRKGARKGVRKGTSKKSRKHYGGKSYQKHQNYYSGGADGDANEPDGDANEPDDAEEAAPSGEAASSVQAGPSDEAAPIVEASSDDAVIDAYEKPITNTAGRDANIAEAYYKSFNKSEAERGTLGGGGSRRRKSRHNKKTHSKKTRGKKTSPWIKHVLQFAKDNKMKYFQALKDKRCRATYKSGK